MSFASYKNEAVSRMKEFVNRSRQDLEMSELKWFVSHQPSIVFDGAAKVDITGQLKDWSQENSSNLHVQALGLLPPQEHLLMDSNGVIKLGLLLADVYLDQR
jgi:hypothetical protein